MAKAKQLPSGSWRVRVYDSETGKYLSFTSNLSIRAHAESPIFRIHNDISAIFQYLIHKYL